jgi:hypothetical protein
MKQNVLFLFFAFILLGTGQTAMAQRKFIHPGITYTQADLDRMKAMIDARREPFYSTFVALSNTIVTPGTLSGITQIKESQHNSTIGMDGRRAHDNALMWHLTGNKAYADNAVKYLNRYLNLTNSSSRGTGPLDNGKIYMLIEAAELMRSYEGWKAEDQAAFKKMLVHPGYSTKAVPSSHYSSTDDDNDVTFYWNIYNFDPGRWGNQGLFSARGLIAMGIFLDNDTIYDRAYRYLRSLPHRPDDLPYQSGPATAGAMTGETAYLRTYNASWGNSIPDYHSGEALQYYIYQNGQCEESCRDQGHVMAGIGNYTCIAEVAWNQGDSLYSCLNNRILTGIEYNNRYNLSFLKSYPDQPAPWSVSGYSTSESDCSYDNGIFYQAWSRSARWFGKDIYPDDRGNGFNSNKWREQSVAHYKVRAGVEPENMKWLQRSLDKLIEDEGYENWGVSGHHYEWFGWGTLTKRRTEWMAGDPGTFINGERISKMPSVPCVIAAVDYDYYAEDGDGHTYLNAGKAKSTLYRTDGAIEIAKDGKSNDNNNYVVTEMLAGEWMNYSLIFPTFGGNTVTEPARKYNVYVTYQSTGTGAKLFAAIDNGEKKGKELAPATEWTERCLGTFTVPCGAAVLRLYVKGTSRLLQLKNLRIEPVKSEELTVINLDVAATVKVYDASNNDISSDNEPVISAATDGDYNVPINVPHQKFLVYDFGEDGFDIRDVTLFNDGITQDGREQVKISGSTQNGKYAEAWNQSTAMNIMRTNGTTYDPLVQVINNAWTTTDGSNGLYCAGPMGKYRYLAVYNWSTTCKISELEIRGITNTSNVEEDTEPSATWDDTNDTGTGMKEAETDKTLGIRISGQEVTILGATAIEAYTLDGNSLVASRNEQIQLSPGIFILKININGQTVNQKIIIK